MSWPLQPSTVDQVTNEFEMVIGYDLYFWFGNRMGLTQMEIQFLTAHLPYPPASGGRRREFELISRLGKHFKIHLCLLTSDPDR